MVTVNASTGEIRVKAEAKDKFDIKVSVKNACGQADTTFNVIIDEET